MTEERTIQNVSQTPGTITVTVLKHPNEKSVDLCTFARCAAFSEEARVLLSLVQNDVKSVLLKGRITQYLQNTI